MLVCRGNAVAVGVAVAAAKVVNGWVVAVKVATAVGRLSVPSGVAVDFAGLKATVGTPVGGAGLGSSEAHPIPINNNKVAKINARRIEPLHNRYTVIAMAQYSFFILPSLPHVWAVPTPHES